MVSNLTRVIRIKKMKLKKKVKRKTHIKIHFPCKLFVGLVVSVIKGNHRRKKKKQKSRY